MLEHPFDDRDGKMWLDGTMVAWCEAKLHVLSHGLHYASCVFEGERVYGGSIYAAREHAQRLANSAAILGYELPYDLSTIHAAKYEVVHHQEIMNGYVRVIAWRGGEQMGIAAPRTRIHLAVAAWPWGSYFSANALSAGVRLVTSRWRRADPQTAPVHSKASCLYAVCTLSKHEAVAQGYDDALMLDYRGQVAESTGSNIFIVKDAKLHTPIADCFLNGITRQSIIRLARRQGIEVFERAIWPSEIRSADEIFLTGTAAEVTPVGQVDDYHVTVGQLTRQLMDDYSSHVRSQADLPE